MTDTQSHNGPTTKHTVVVPASINMVSLLGPGDEHLALIERSFDADVHVRGNQVTLQGEPAEVALVERLLDELVDAHPHRPGRHHRDGRAGHRRCCAPRPPSAPPTC